jgi:hypothetical protein
MTDAQVQLFRALKAHKSELEIERVVASDCDLEERIEATQQLLEWLSRALEPHPPAFRRAQPGNTTAREALRPGPRVAAQSSA